MILSAPGSEGIVERGGSPTTLRLFASNLVSNALAWPFASAMDRISDGCLRLAFLPGRIAGA